MTRSAKWRVLLLLGIGLAGCQTSPVKNEKEAGTFQGENLIQHFPFPELHWQHRSGDKGGMHVSEWTADTGERFNTIVFIGDREITLESYRAIDASGGQQNCQHFSKEELVDAAQGEYPSGTWISRCEKGDGPKRVILQKAIRGKDSFYNAKMIWNGEPSADSLDLWVKYLNTIYVCDTRKPNSACPTGNSSSKSQP